MSGLLASVDLTAVWAGLLAFIVLAYVVLDGFDLGVGILFLAERGKEDRDVMVNTIAPVWDGNETWLILGGGGLLAVAISWSISAMSTSRHDSRSRASHSSTFACSGSASASRISSGG